MLPPSYKHIFLFKLCSFSILFYQSCRDSSLKRLISLALPSHIFQFKQVDTVSNLGSCLGLNQIPKPLHLWRSSGSTLSHTQMTKLLALSLRESQATLLYMQAEVPSSVSQSTGTAADL